MLNIVHNDDYANVQGIVAMPKGMECPELVNKIQRFNIEDPDMELFETFSDKMKDRIRKAPEWAAPPGAQEPPSDFDDDIPF